MSREHNATNRRRPAIAVDMDEVIADALGEHLLRYNRDFADVLDAPLTRAELHGSWLWDAVPPERLGALEQYIRSEDFFAVLDVMPDAQRVLQRLQEHYEIYIATAAMEVPTSFQAKYRWLQQHFPFIAPSHVVFCGDKGILRADYLIDDNPRQLRLFEARAEGEPGGDAPQTRREGILYASPANVRVEGFRRVQNWLEVEALFLGEDGPLGSR